MEPGNSPGSMPGLFARASDPKPSPNATSHGVSAAGKSSCTNQMTKQEDCTRYAVSV
jgi:hypothetical protein